VNAPTAVGAALGRDRATAGDVTNTRSALVDPFGRDISYLRLSVTDRCDFRCVYCMAEDMKFLPRQQILSLEELLAVATAFVELGTTKIRLTGGEPLVRQNIVWLAERIARLPGLRELVLTTNGSRLAQMAPVLRAAGLRRINVSLDSLDPQRFRALTRTGDLATVLRGIEAAQRAGFERIKLNSVILRGRNDDEVLPLVRFARDNGLDITFIEEMPLGLIEEHDRALCFVSSDELQAAVDASWPLTASAESSGGPAHYWRMADSATRVGFISPHSHNFCHLCNRVRLTVEGRLLLCLGNEHSADLRAVLRTHPGDNERLRAAIVAALPLKPEKHHFDLAAAPDIVRFMSMTGG
jgi:cyclic pyranopterin phosphate synthase